MLPVTDAPAAVFECGVRLAQPVSTIIQLCFQLADALVAIFERDTGLA